MTYAALAVVLVALAAVAAVVGARRLPTREARRRHWIAVFIASLILVILTAVFDNVMIAGDLYTYGTAGTSGVTVWLAPIEDFAYPVACALGVPGVWLLMTQSSQGVESGK